MYPFTRLCPHVIPQHLGQEDQDAMARWQPAVMKFLDPDPDLVARWHAANPAALLLLRDWSLSEQHDDAFAHPEATGNYHAEMMAERARQWAPNIDAQQVVVTGLNEFQVWRPNGVDTAVRYTVAYLNRLAQLGRRGGALNLSVGWPDNTGPDTPVGWEPYAPIMSAIQAGRHVLVLHEYWCKDGPGFMWRWWAGRYLQCPWQVPIIIGECGCDQYVQGGDVSAGRGWADYMNGERYMAQLQWYDTQLRADARILGATIFTYDFSHPWSSFDVRPLREQLCAYAEQLRAEAPPQPAPGPEPMPHDETATDAATLKQKVRWWTEQSLREHEAGNDLRAWAILYDMVTLDPPGLMYRSERAT